MKRKQYEEKFDVDVTDDPSSGKTSVQDREKDEVSNDKNWISRTLGLKSIIDTLKLANNNENKLIVFR